MTPRVVCPSLLLFASLALLPTSLTAQTSPDKEAAEKEGWSSEWSVKPDPAFAEPAKKGPQGTSPPSLGAEVRPRVEARRTDDTWSEVMSYRVRIDVSGRVGRLEGFVQPQASGVYGLTGTRTPNTPGIGIFQAYLRYGEERLNVQAGRFQLTYGEEVIWSRAEWNQVGRASDAIRVHGVPTKGVEIDAFGAKYADFPDINGITEPAYTFDSYMGAVIVQLKPSLLAPIMHEIDVYALRDHRATPTSYDGPNRDRVSAFGTRLKGKWNTADARLEVVGQTGDNCTLALSNEQSANCVDYEDVRRRRAFMGEAEVGVALIDTLRLELGSIYASGDDESTEDVIEAYDPLYAAAHRHLGLADIFRRTDVFQARTGITFDNKRTMLDLMAHHFWDASFDPRGLEVDVTARYKFKDGLTLQTGFSHLFPTNSDQVAVTWAYLQAIAAFK